MPGVLADSSTGLTAWSCELPGLVEPAGWLIEPPPVSGLEDVEDEDLPVHPHAAGPTREVVAQVRSNALAFVANETGPFRVEFTDGTTSGTPAHDRVRAADHRRPRGQRDPRAPT